MKQLLLLMGMVGVSVSVSAADFCERMPVDPEFPAGLNGSYEILGKDPVTEVSYTGTLVLSYSKDSYKLSRTIQGRIVNGNAWIERCGVDKIETLIVRYDTEPVIEMTCTFGTDGDNYYRTTCRARQGKHQWRGLEAWFQQK